MEKSRNELILPELYFLIQKFLSTSPLQETYKVLCNEIERNKILPNRLDWKGNSHEREFEDLERLYPHIVSDHLLQICNRIGPILDKEIPPSLKGVASLLGSGRQSLLRTNESIAERKTSLLYYATRLHRMPITADHRTTHNIVNVLVGRETSGPCPRSLLMPCERYSQLKLHRQTLGHLSSVYCLIFDHTGRYIATGADDLLIKLWSCVTGRLLTSFRGATGEITDIDINTENNLLAAGSMDRILRVWNLQTGAPVAILTCHTGMITSVNFCPSSMWYVRYLVTTSTDGSVAFWTYNHDSRNNVHFVSKPVLFHEKMRPGQAQMICSAFSPGGAFLAAGSADHNVRVYLLRGEEGPVRILETEVHTDRVDSLCWAHRGLKFVSGSKDGTAHIWQFETQQWKSKKLDMTTKMPGHVSDDEPKKPFRVSMVVFDYSDTFVITAVSDHTLKVWRSSTGQLERDLLHHTKEIYVLESHPSDPYIILSAGHDGLICVWNIFTGTRLVEFTNQVEGQGVGEVYDVKWSPDGAHVAASDAYGHILIFGFDCGDSRLKKLPKELFFHTDYRPLVHDPERGVLDEQTQIPPHLMPPPFLVDIDGNPYPPMLQRLVPGRENCTSEQLVPNIVFGTGGRQEVIEGLPDGDQPRSDIDRMIEDIARRHNPDDAPRAPAVRQGHRRSGDVEGVRQSTGDWQSGNIEWTSNSYIKSISKNEEEYFKEHVDFLCNLEMDEYKSEMKRRPIMISTSTPLANKLDRGRRRRPNGSQYTNTRRSLRTVREDDEPEEQDAEESANESASSHHSDYSSTRPDDITSESSDESSGYSDWVADQGVTLQPPKRSKRKFAHRKINMSDSDDDNEEEEEEEEDEELREKDENTDERDQGADNKSEKRSKAKKSAVKKTATIVVNGFSEPSTSRKKAPPPPKKNVKRIFKNGEIPEHYKPSEWLAETVPRKAPYWPQMGDEVVYFVQGHRIYVESVKAKSIYSVNTKELPWTKHELKDHEYVKIVGIKYEIRPPRLCCLKLALLDDDKKFTDKDFTIKYHDMADVLDFIILSQTYDLAVTRNWNPGDRFRCMIEDAWWMGKSERKSALNDDYPDSLFSCYEIQWDSGEFERMSPWDMEAINDERLPENLGEAVPILSAELQALLYTPTTDEWPNGDRDAACARIISGLDYIMALAIAEPFLAPVDLNIYPTYAFIVEYPIDLTTIKVRLENRFYRRITSVQFDVRYLATNAEKFNKPHSCIVKFARIITEICLKLMSTIEDVDLPTIYHQLMETYESSGTEEDNDVNDASYNAHDDNSDEDIDVVNSGAGPSTRPSTSNASVTMNGAHHSRHNGNSSNVIRSLRSARLKQNGPSGSSATTTAAAAAANESDPEFACGASGTQNSKYSNDWRLEARRLLERLWHSEDSAPFRAPVDHLKHPDYYQLIDTPMDLGSIKEDLFGGNYESPQDFAKDVRLVFTNSKHYNTNNRSRIYSMTNRLSIKFEKYIKDVLQVWRRGKRVANTAVKGQTKRPKRRRVKKPSTSNNDTTTEESLPEEEEDNESEQELEQGANEKNDKENESEEEERNDHVEENNIADDDDDDDQQASEDENGTVDPLKDTREDDLTAVRLNGRNKRIQSNSDDDDDDDDSFSDSEKIPLSQGRVVASSVPSSDDSDSQPLSQLRGRNNKAHSSSHRRKGTLQIHSSTNDDDSNLSASIARNRRRRKRIKLSLSDEEEMTDGTTSNTSNGNSDNSDSDSMPLNVIRDRETSVHLSQNEEMSNEGSSSNPGEVVAVVQQQRDESDDHSYGRLQQRPNPIVSISSRGRVRKITERARALFR